MDDARFDALTRFVSAVTTRRATLAGLSGLVTLLVRLVVAPSTDAQGRRICRPLGRVCSPGRGLVCCGGAACRQGRCRCGPRRRVCRGRCIAKGRCCRNRECRGGRICRQGRCQCPAGKQLCGGRCVNLRTDARHCGDCATACAGTATCQAGVCVAGARYRLVRQWNGAASGTAFDEPTAVAVDRAGFVYVTDAGTNRVLKFTANGGLVAAWSSVGAGPSGIAVSAAGIVYVANKFSNTLQSFTSDGSPSTVWTTLAFPSGLDIGPAGDIYVAISGADNAVQRFRPNGTTDTWGPPTFDFVEPEGVGTAPSGDVYVADTGNCQIERFSANGAAKGIWGDEGSGNGQFEDPMGVTVDGAGFVYVADSENQRLQKFTAGGAFRGAWGADVLASPFDVAVSRSGMVYVADGGSNAAVVQFVPA